MILTSIKKWDWFPVSQFKCVAAEKQQTVDADSSITTTPVKCYTAADWPIHLIEGESSGGNSGAVLDQRRLFFGAAQIKNIIRWVFSLLPSSNKDDVPKRGRGFSPPEPSKKRNKIVCGIVQRILAKSHFESQIESPLSPEIRSHINKCKSCQEKEKDIRNVNMYVKVNKRRRYYSW